MFGCGGDEVQAPADELGPLIFVESANGEQHVASLTTEGQHAAELDARHMLIVSPRWSLSGAMIAYVGFETDRLRDLWIVEVDDEGRAGEQRSVLRWDTAENPPLLHWLPDDSGLLWSEMTDTHAALRRLDLASEATTWHHQAQLSDIDVAGDGRVVGVVPVDELHHAVAVFDSAFEQLLELEPDLGGSPRWSPDASEIAFLVHDPPGVAVLDPESGTWERLTDADDEHLRWSPDGSRLSFVRASQLVLLDRVSEDETIVLDTNAGAHEWSRSAEHIAMPGPGRALRLLSVGDGRVIEVEDIPASIPSLDWGPAG